MLSPEAARHLTVLDDLLVDCFSSAELVRLVEQTFGIAATGDLPVSAESSRLFMFHAVRALLRRGLLGTTFFAALARERPQRGAEIRRLAAALTLRVDVDPSEGQTLVWRGGSGEGSRLELVAALEQNLLARDRLAPGDAAAAGIDQAIDGLARRLRGAPMLTPGSVLATTRLEQVLGAGNFGTVWRARHLHSGQRVATKVFHLDRLTDGVMLWRFRRSIRALQALNRYRDKPASIPSILAEAPDSLAFVMPYYAGGTLEMIERRGWSLSTKLAVFLEVCRAVEFAHRVGVIHRDIKPANILLDGAQRPVLVDYDIADINFVTQLAAAQGGLGTPVFAAPEQLEDAGAADERSDIYSLGRLLHYLLLERSPGYQIESDPELDNLRDFHPALVAAVRRATQWSAERRHASVLELIVEIERHHTGSAALRARCTGGWRWIRHHAAVLSICATITGASLGLANMQRDVAAARQTTIESAREHTRRNDDNITALAELGRRLEDLTRGLVALRSDTDELVDACDDATALRFASHVVTLQREAGDLRSGLEATTAAVADTQTLLWNTLSSAAPATAMPPAPPPLAAAAPVVALAHGWVPRTRHDADPTTGTGASQRAPDRETTVEPAPTAAAIPAPPVRRRGSRTHLEHRSAADLNATLVEIQPRLVGCLHATRSEDHERPLHLTISIGRAGKITQWQSSRPLQNITRACMGRHLLALEFGAFSRGDRYVHDVIGS